ncbi:MAG TPA: sigma-54-dependent Fis family transcriptional regulator [Oceanospirillaceae bacterium]|nr:sigma-54-dependent Fis family transcriptional regulator [Oceanospirillaceae bacterium]
MRNDVENHVLIIDDEPEVRRALAYLFAKQGWITSELSNAKDARAKILQKKPYLVICDVRMPGKSGLQLFNEIDPIERPPFIFISAHADVEMAVGAMQQGAYTFFEKPYEAKRLLHAANNAAAQYKLSLQNSLLLQQVSDLSGLDQLLIGSSAGLQAVRKMLVQFAQLEAPVMILGETGTGKELAAKALHTLSKRAAKPFVTVDCAAVSAGEFAQSMFGSHAKPGYVDKANGGTLFLDELTSFSYEQQGQLLRLLESGEYQRLDSIDQVKADLRIVSATNLPKDKLLEDNLLRKDLKYRLDNLTLMMPPLRDSGDDIVLLFNHFIAKCCQLHSLPPPTVSAVELSTLMAHGWPGNVRELKHVAERLVIYSKVKTTSLLEVLSGESAPESQRQGLRAAVAEFEKALISKVIVEQQGRMDEVAEELAIGRRTLNEKMVKLDLDRNTLL